MGASRVAVAVASDTDRLTTALEIIARHATECAAELRQLDEPAADAGTD
jgi:hypothetical protein